MNLAHLPFQIGRLEKRYKRFLADVILPSGELITAHNANTGSMESCLMPGQQAFLTYHDSPTRKLKWSLQALKGPDSWIGIHTPNANALASEAISSQQIPELRGYKKQQAEVGFLTSRFDFFLSEHEQGQPDCYVEVKNVTLRGPDNLALFPDSPSVRGQKHLDELIEVVKQGHRAAMLYIVQREDVFAFCPAVDHDPIYAQKLREAWSQGVEIYVYQCRVRPPEISVEAELPWFFLDQDGQIDSPKS